MEFDYVCTGIRPTKRVAGSHQERVMSARRFQQMLVALSLGEDAEWATMGEREFDEALDDTLREVQHLPEPDVSPSRNPTVR